MVKICELPLVCFLLRHHFTISEVLHFASLPFYQFFSSPFLHLAFLHIIKPDTRHGKFLQLTKSTQLIIHQGPTSQVKVKAKSYREIQFSQNQIKPTKDRKRKIRNEFKNSRSRVSHPKLTRQSAPSPL